MGTEGRGKGQHTQDKKVRDGFRHIEEARKRQVTIKKGRGRVHGEDEIGRSRGHTYQIRREEEQDQKKTETLESRG